MALQDQLQCGRRGGKPRALEVRRCTVFASFNSAPGAFPTRSLSGPQGLFSGMAGLSQHPQPLAVMLLAGVPGRESGERSKTGQFGPETLFGEVAGFPVSDRTIAAS